MWQAGRVLTHTHTHIINVSIHRLPWLCSCEMTILKQHWQECSWAGRTFTPLGSARSSICQHWVRRSATVVCISIVTLTIPICLYLYFQRLHLPCLRSPSSAVFWKLKPGLPMTWSKSPVANMQSSWLWPPVCSSRRWLNFTLHVESCSISLSWRRYTGSGHPGLLHLLQLLYRIWLHLKPTSRLWPSPSDSVAGTIILVFEPSEWNPVWTPHQTPGQRRSIQSSVLHQPLDRYHPHAEAPVLFPVKSMSCLPLNSYSSSPHSAAHSLLTDCWLASPRPAENRTKGFRGCGHPSEAQSGTSLDCASKSALNKQTLAARLAVEWLLCKASLGSLEGPKYTAKLWSSSWIDFWSKLGVLIAGQMLKIVSWKCSSSPFRLPVWPVFLEADDVQQSISSDCNR